MKQIQESFEQFYSDSPISKTSLVSIPIDLVKEAMYIAFLAGHEDIVQELSVELTNR